MEFGNQYEDYRREVPALLPFQFLRFTRNSSQQVTPRAALLQASSLSSAHQHAPLPHQLVEVRLVENGEGLSQRLATLRRAASIRASSIGPRRSAASLRYGTAQGSMSISRQTVASTAAGQVPTSTRPIVLERAHDRAVAFHAVDAIDDGDRLAAARR